MLYRYVVIVFSFFLIVNSVHGQFGLNLLPGVSAIDITGLDIDGDGDEELFWVNEGLFWQENLGYGNFGPATLLWNDFDCDDWGMGGCNPFAFRIDRGDVDNDSITDLIIITYDDTNAFSSDGRVNQIIWFRNFLNGSLGNGQVVGSFGFSPDDDGFISTSFFADMDGDGDNDFFANNPAQLWGAGYLFFENLGNGTSWQQYQIVHPVDDSYESDSKVFAADLDENGIKEFIYSANTHCCISDVTLIRANNQPDFDTLIYSDLKNFFAFDWDEDGDQDILLSLNDGSFDDHAIGWMENLGGMVFNNYVELFDNVQLANFTADIDGDGVENLIVKDDTNFGWLQQLDSGQWVLNPVFGHPLPQYGADFDGDGDIDLAGMSGFPNPNDTYLYESFMGSRFNLNGREFYDLDQNGQYDNDDLHLSNILITINDEGYAIPVNGQFSFSVAEGWHEISYVPNPSWNLTTDSSSYTVFVEENNPVFDNLDFGFFPNTIFTEIETQLTGGFPRCNDVVSFWINLQNTGTNRPSGVIALDLDPALTYVSSEILPDSVTGQTIYWHYDSLAYAGQFQFGLQVMMPPVEFAGDTLTSLLTVHELDNGNVVYSVSDTVSQVVVCAVDPNDKLVTPSGNGPDGFIQMDQQLEYTIRFQNTGTDTAFNVMIRDQLSPHLDRSAFEFLGSSHQPEVWIENDGEAVFSFDTIMLPYSNVNEPASHGFVKFGIRPLPTVIPLTEIRNSADIYFDLNPAIVTNTTLNTICSSPEVPVDIMYDSETGVLYVPELANVSYHWYFNDNPLTDSVATAIVPAEEGIYSVLITDDFGCFSFFTPPFEWIKVSTHIPETLSWTIYPNPAGQSAVIAFGQPLSGEYSLNVYNVMGGLVCSKEMTGSEVVVDRQQTGKGIFFITIGNNQSGEVTPLGTLVVF